MKTFDFTDIFPLKFLPIKFSGVVSQRRNLGRQVRRPRVTITGFFEVIVLGSLQSYDSEEVIKRIFGK